MKMPMPARKRQVSAARISVWVPGFGMLTILD
jgi:hypothetical protein